ncbi:MAG: Nudix family hydrolase [Gammaproteobacteria bacterium]|nr:Nudix family hydrolase [Gammaproteobacteria bacterium]
MTRPAIHVVAGLLIDGRRICLSRRRADVHQAGKWEFPGGKLHAGETPYAALARELHEELGIDVEQAQPFVQVHHAYPELDVLLDIWQVQRYRGVPYGREDQEVRWSDIAQLVPSEFPNADRPVLRRLQLPSLYLISDAHRLGEAVFEQRLERALAAGARLVQLREPGLDRQRFCAYARRLSTVCRQYGARLLVNAEPEWVRECDADGVHLNSRRLMTLSVRPLGVDQWVAASCHNAAEIKRAQALAVDFVVLGPVQSTASHPAATVLGWDAFAALSVDSPLPIYALGGMRTDDISPARANGAQGLAMISGVWGCDDFERVVRALSPQS